MKKKILGLIIDKKLNYKSHINELCKKAFQKLGALCRFSSHLNNFQLDYKSPIQLLFFSMDVLFENIEHHDHELHERSTGIKLNDY